MALPDVPDVYRVKLNMTFNGLPAVNVFYYRDVDIAGFAPLAVAQGFWDKVKAAWRAFLPNTSGFIFVSSECEALFGDHAFGTYPIPSAESLGTRATGGTEALPPTLAAVIKLNVATRTTRPGSKRISGLLEVDVNYNTIVGSTFTLLQTLGGVFDDNFIPTGAVANIHPVIVGYPTMLQPGDPRVQDVTGNTVSPYVGHQVSRDPRP